MEKKKKIRLIIDSLVLVLCLAIAFFVWHKRINDNRKTKAIELYYQGKQFDIEGNYPEARKCLDQSIKLYPHLGKAYLMSGVVYQREGEIYKAEEELKKSLEFEMQIYNKAIAHYNLGSIYLENMSRYDDAIREFTASIEANPNFFNANDDAYYGLARTYFFKNNYQKAIEYANKSLELNPENELARKIIYRAKRISEGGEISLDIANYKIRLENEGFSLGEMDNLLGHYYKNPQPERLIKFIKLHLTIEYFVNIDRAFKPFTYFVAAVASDNEDFFNSLKSLKEELTDAQQPALEEIIKMVEGFKFLSPDSPEELDYLWAQFSATGSKEPIKKIISVLNSQATTPDDHLLSATAEWSLRAMAREHKEAYEIIQEESMTATKELKEKLDSILELTSW